MIIYQNKQDKVVTIKLSKNRMTFAAKNFKVRNWVVIYQKTSLIMRNLGKRSERGDFFDDFIA